MKQAPHKEWTYREIECQLYKHQKPDGFQWVGYVKVGDEWHEVIDRAIEEESKAVSLVEKNVDKLIRKALTEQEPTRYDPLYPTPTPAPEPDPWDSPTTTISSMSETLW